MSGQSSQRPLTLTEELEKLEQSITLTLQEIDHNFSQAHRVVTTSILPLVEQYAEHSRDVWEGAKFWKQFFEASANVSLSGYEEHPNEETTEGQTTTDEDPSNVTQTTSTETETESYETPSSERHRPDELDLSSLSISSHSTPRPPSHAKPKPTDDTTSSTLTDTSPYETLRKQIKETDSPFSVQQDTTSTFPSTPGRKDTSHLRNHGFDPDTSSPFVPPASHEKPSTAKRYQKPTNPILHHMLDKTYRVQATPLGKGKGYAPGPGTGTRSKFTATPKPSTSKLAFDDSPLSSPELEAPQLHSEIFSSPIKGVATTPTPRRNKSQSQKTRGTPKPTPGTSVLTPAKGKGKGKGKWDSDDDFDDEDGDDEFDFGEGPSPPKTMQFHVPQSRLMKTPAKEASKRIVSDLLASAGANDVTESVDEEQSPSVVQRVERLEDETF